MVGVKTESRGSLFPRNPELSLVSVLGQCSRIESIRRMDASYIRSRDGFWSRIRVSFQKLEANSFTQSDNFLQRQLQFCIITPEQRTEIKPDTSRLEKSMDVLDVREDVSGSVEEEMGDEHILCR